TAVVEGWSDPGTINLTPPGVEGTWEASASSRAAVMVIRPAFISRALEEHWGADSSKVEIKMQFLIRDPVIEAITLSLAWEAASGSPAGRLYMESGCRIPRASSDLPLFQLVPAAAAIRGRSFKSRAQACSAVH
ncbi:MAG TPA: hypothetical protein VGI22_15635, partial [Xanthobacteraceae bacterium]